MQNINQFIEHTLLSSTTTDAMLEQLITEAKTYALYGVCVPPFWVKKASREIGEAPISLVTVIGFPLGYQKTESKILEIEQAILDGANEVDVVLNVSAVKSQMTWPKIEIAQCCKKAHEEGVLVKLILETALLTDQEIAGVSKIACDAGVDFIKTSTGFGSRGASVQDIALIKSVIPENVGIKASGGIKTLQQAMELIQAGADKIGTSSGVAIVEESRI